MHKTKKIRAFLHEWGGGGGIFASTGADSSTCFCVGRLRGTAARSILFSRQDVDSAPSFQPARPPGSTWNWGREKTSGDRQICGKPNFPYEGWGTPHPAIFPLKTREMELEDPPPSHFPYED